MRIPAGLVVRLAAIVALWVATVSLTVRIGVTLRTDYSEYVFEHYLPFLAAWVALSALAASVLGGVLYAGRWRAFAVIFLVLGIAALYYGIGRRPELLALKHQTPFHVAGTFFDPKVELVVPIVVGAIWAGLAAFFFQLICRTPGQAGFLDIRRFLTGVAIYLLIGLLFWMQSAAAWLGITAITGVSPSPVQEPWIRFADEAGPYMVFWQVLVWPGDVVACCG